MRQIFILFLLSIISSIALGTEYSEYGQSETQYVTSFTTPTSIKFEVNKILRRKNTTWHVNGVEDTDAQDWSEDSWVTGGIDPDYTVYCDYGTTKIEAKVYNDTWNWEETHIWYVTIVNTTPTATRKYPSTSSISIAIGSEQDFTATVYDAEGESDFDNVKWYVNSSLEETNNYYSITWNNPHDDDFSYTFDNSGTHTVKAIVTDNAGNTASISWTVYVINTAPTATRKYPSSSSISLTMGDQQDFTATVYDADGESNFDNVKWYVNNSLKETNNYSQAFWDNPHDDDFSYTFDNSGTYTVKATVTDEGGKTASVSWTVNVINNAPTATRKNPSSSSISLTMGDQQDFTATVYDADGESNFDNVKWYVNNSLKETNNYSQAFWDNPHDDDFSYTFDNSGTYTVKATVTDEGGKTASVSWTVNVINNAPTATRKEPSSSSLSLIIGTQQDFTATVYDEDGESNFDKVEWFVDNSLEETNNYSQAFWDNPHDDDFSYTFDNSGTYTIKATVTDKGGKTASISWTVTVINNAPTATRKEPSSSSLSLIIGTQQDFTATVYDEDGESNFDKVEWFVDNSLEETNNYSQVFWDNPHDDDFSYTFDNSGSYTVTATVTDKGGKTASVSWAVTVINNAPTATRKDPSSSSISLTMGAQQNFTATVYDEDGESNFDKVEWFVDNSLEETNNYSQAFWDNPHDDDFSYAFDNSGTYTVKATVTDKGGKTASVSWTVTVINNAPTATRKDPSNSNISLAIGTKQDFTATVYDEDGESNFDKVEWLVDNSLEETNNYSQFFWDNPHDDDFNYTFEQSGTHIVTARVVDKGGETASVSWTIYIKIPDLSVTDLNVWPETDVEPGSELSWSYVVTNVGDVESKKCKAKFVLLDNQSNVVSDILKIRNDLNNKNDIDEIIPDGVFEINSSGVVNNKMVIPDDISSGVYYIKVIVDCDNELIGEENKTNNEATFEIEVNIKYPDLVVLEPTLDKTSIAIGEKISATCIVKNIGGTKADASTLRYALSIDTIWDGVSDVNLGGDPIEQLEIDEESPEDKSIEIPDDEEIQEGGYYILFVADYARVNDENGHLENNIKWSSIEITKGPNEPIELKFNDYEVYDYESMPEEPIYLEIKLQKGVLNIPLINKEVVFDYKVNDSWIPIYNDGISYTSTNTTIFGKASTYFIPDIKSDEVTEPKVITVRATYNNDGIAYSDEKPILIQPTIHYDDNKKELYEIYKNPNPNTEIAVVLIHGNGSDKFESEDESDYKSFMRWNSFRTYILNNTNQFADMDVWAWRHSTNIPVGFNGISGNAAELTDFIENLKSSQYANKSVKFLFVCHSRGGLVARSYTAYGDHHENILGILTLGTPHLGSPMAVPDWSAETWYGNPVKIDNYLSGFSALGDWAYNNSYSVLVNVKKNEIDPLTNFVYDRIGSLDLAWDNSDRALDNKTSFRILPIYFPPLFADGYKVNTTPNDGGTTSFGEDFTVCYPNEYKSKYGTLGELNQKYFGLENKHLRDKLITYAGHYSYMSNVSSSKEDDSKAPEVVEQQALRLMGGLMSFIKGGNDVDYIANDGMVPLQSGLLLDVSQADSYTDKNIFGAKVNVNEAKVARDFKCKSYRIYNSEHPYKITDHLQMVSPPTQDYWFDVITDLQTFVPKGIPNMPDGIYAIDNIFDSEPEFKWTEYSCADGTSQKAYQFRVWDDIEGRVIYDTGLKLSTDGSTHQFTPGDYVGYDQYAWKGTRLSEPLVYGHDYHWHVRYMSEMGKWSDWSNYSNNSDNYIRFSLREYPEIIGDLSFENNNGDKDYFIISNISNQDDFTIDYDHSLLSQGNVELYNENMYKVWFEILTNNSSESVTESNITILFGEEYNNYSTSINATQNGINKYFEVSEDILFPYNSNQLDSIIIKTNADDWDYQISSDAGWLNVNADKENFKMYFQPLAFNYSDVENNATVTFTSAGLDDKIVNVLQKSFIAELDVSSTNIELARESGSVDQVDVIANFSDWEFELISGLDWLSTDRIMNDVIISSITNNDEVDSRIGKIRVYGKNIEKIITVTQLGSEAFIDVPSNQFRVSNDLNSVKEFMITSNINWEISSPEWLQLDKISGIGNSTVKIFVTEITTVNRQGEIIVYNAEFPELNDTIIITQSIAPSLLIESQIAETEENNPDGLEIFELKITNPNAIDVLYSINEDNIPFSIINGIVSISNSEQLDYEKIKKFEFTVNIQEEGNIENYDEAIITINLLNLNDCSPQFITDNLSKAVTNNEYSEFIQVIDNDFLSDDLSEISVIGELPGWLQFENFGYYATIKGTPTVDDIGINIITLKVTDGIEDDIQEFNINVTHVNDKPTDISLSNNSINENSASGKVIGYFTATDFDQEDTHTFSLTEGDGTNDIDNGLLIIDGDSLKVASELDYENKTEYSIYVQTKDAQEMTFEKAFVIAVEDINESPVDIILSIDSIDEGLPVATVVGELTTSDPDYGDMFEYSLVAGDGTNDSGNGSFVMEDNYLKTATELDFETQTEYKINIQTEDIGGLTYNESFVIHVNDVTETDIEELEISQISVYPNPTEGLVYVDSKLNFSKIIVVNLAGEKELIVEHGKRIDMTKLSQGIYFIQLADNKENIIGVVKIVKK